MADEKSKVDDFISSNGRWLITLLFLAGFAYAEMRNFGNVENRLTKKINVLNDLAEDVEDLKIEKEVMKAMIPILIENAILKNNNEILKAHENE